MAYNWVFFFVYQRLKLSHTHMTIKPCILTNQVYVSPINPKKQQQQKKKQNKYNN